MAQAKLETGEQKDGRMRRSERGFSLIEMMLVVLISIVLTAIAAPNIRTAVFRYRLEGAVASSTWAIQSTRYQSLMQGYQYQVVFSHTSNTYQIQDDPTGSGTFSNVGNPIPLSGQPIALNADTTFTFKPNGFVNDPANLYYMTVTYQGMCQKIKVTNYANITLTTIAPTCP